MKELSIQGRTSPPLMDRAEIPSPGSQGTKGFGEILRGSMNEVNDLQIQADQAIQELAAGESKSLHETMILLEKADISFRLMMQVRNKLLEAYRDIMHMQV